MKEPGPGLNRLRARKLWRDWRGTLLFMLGMLVFRSAVADWMQVPSGSMNPTVIEGDRVLVNKHAYGWRVPFTLEPIVPVGDPQRGDVVVLESPESGITLLKRVVGLPGDVIALSGDFLVINGQPVPYTEASEDLARQLLSSARAMSPHFATEDLPGKSHSIMLLEGRAMARRIGPFRIPEGRYLVLGDNRDNSRDSRYFGLVERRAIFGKATRVLVSLDPEHLYLPRTGRFLEPLL